MSDMGSHNFPAARPLPTDDNASEKKEVAGHAPKRAEGHKIGEVIEIAGSGSRIILDGNVLAKLMEHPDPTVQMAGQVGSQIKIRVGTTCAFSKYQNPKDA